MALTSKSVGTNPSAATLTTAYTVPAATQFVGRVIVTNRSATPTAFRIAISPGGAAIDDKHYIAYDVAIGANDVYVSPPLALTATDLIRVYATLATLGFQVTGLEKT